jgi:hypothetical protein
MAISLPSTREIHHWEIHIGFSNTPAVLSILNGTVVCKEISTSLKCISPAYMCISLYRLISQPYHMLEQQKIWIVSPAYWNNWVKCRFQQKNIPTKYGDILLFQVIPASTLGSTGDSIGGFHVNCRVQTVGCILRRDSNCCRFAITIIIWRNLIFVSYFKLLRILFFHNNVNILKFMVLQYHRDLAEGTKVNSIVFEVNCMIVWFCVDKILYGNNFFLHSISLKTKPI